MLAQLGQANLVGIGQAASLFHLAFASLIFILAHRVVSGSRVRARIAKRLGEANFRRAFAVLSIALSAWLVWSYVECASQHVLPLSPGARGILWVVGCVGVLLALMGITTANPTIAGMGGRVGDADIVRGVVRITRHPFLVGVALISAVHLVARPFLPEWLFLGTLIFVALTGTLSIDRKRRDIWGADWEAFANSTSIIPFVAVLEGRQRVALSEFSNTQIALIVIAWIVVGLCHAGLL